MYIIYIRLSFKLTIFFHSYSCFLIRSASVSCGDRKAADKALAADT